MFTGIVAELGSIESTIEANGGLALRVRARQAAARTAVGDSVSINGCCLTATPVDDGSLHFHAVPETVGRTTLGELETGARVNVEPALRAGEPLGGHYVQGHVDGVGRIRSVETEGEGVRVVIEAPDAVIRYCVEKGSVAVDGVSLTIAELGQGEIVVALAPHTLEVTTLGAARPGQRVNLEADVLAKYVERLVLGEKA
jgi:riboflavin synthase alpha subunit